MIWTYQLRWDTIGADGHPLVNTPDLDRYNANDMPFPVRAEDENFFDPDSGIPVTDAQWKTITQHDYELISHGDDRIGRILSARDGGELLARILAADPVYPKRTADD
jgi:hypothetical protein